jgi:hypothetical protein
MSEPSVPSGLSTVSSVRLRSVVGLAVVEIVLGVFSFLGGFVHIFLGIGSIVTFTGGEAILGTVANILGTSLVLFGILFLIAGTATLRATAWAWPFGVAVSLAGFCVGVVSLVLGTVGSIPGLVLAGLALYLLFRPTVRASLGHG